MRIRSRNRRRRGARLVGFALVYSLLILYGILIGGLDVFRYQQVALLAREGARRASVHGARYAKETGLPAAMESDLREQVIRPRVIVLVLSLLKSSIDLKNKIT